MVSKRLQDYIAAMKEEDYKEQFANIKTEEKELRKFLGRIDEIDDSILPQVTEILDDAWQLPFEHNSIVDFIIDLYKCELTHFYEGGVSEYIETIKSVIQDELALDEEFDELIVILE